MIQLKAKDFGLLADANGAIIAYWCNVAYSLKLPEAVIGSSLGKNMWEKFQKIMMGSFII